MSKLLAQSESALVFGVKLKGDLSRALVDLERTSSFSNAVLFTLRSSSRSTSSRWCLVSSCFVCFSSSSLLRSNRAFSSLILVLNSISNFFVFSSHLWFPEDVSDTFSVSWPLAVAPVCTVLATGLSVGYCCRFRCHLLLELRCFSWHSLLVACLC